MAIQVTTPMLLPEQDQIDGEILGKTRMKGRWETGRILDVFGA